MDQPYFSLTVREFWSVRWNSVIQRCLKRIAFEPIMTLFSRKNAKSRQLVTMLAVFSTFLLSGLMHEWLILVMTDRPTTWEQLTFFITQGVVTVLEYLLIEFIRFITGKDILKTVPWYFLALYQNLVMMLTLPLFFNPLVRERTFLDLTVWVL